MKLNNFINPIARAIAMQRRKYSTQTVKPKKGKGSYERNSKNIQSEIKKDLQDKDK
jgi:stalled ribosome alternative rescue factor ArfA